jgi:uncharacterized protein (UPF0332 family)
MNDPERGALILYRLEQARSTLRQSEILANADEWSGVVNRAYYAMFYAALALLLTKDLGTSKHTGVLALIDREFVKPGLLPKEMSRVLRAAFNARQKIDYKELVVIEPERAREVLAHAKTFIEVVAEYLDANQR